MRILSAKGLSLEEIIAVAEANSGTVKSSSAAIRQKRYRDNKAAKTVTRDVTGDAVDTVTDDVTNRNDVTPPRARVEDNPLRLVITGYPSSSFKREGEFEDGDDWPMPDEHGGYVGRLAMLAGPGLGDPAKEPGLITTSPEIIRWRQMGCSWSLDVVPTIRARTLKPRANPVTGWNLLTRDVLAAKARREAPVEVPQVGQSPPGFQSSGQAAAAMREAGTQRLLDRLAAGE